MSDTERQPIPLFMQHCGDAMDAINRAVLRGTDTTEGIHELRSARMCADAAGRMTTTDYRAEQIVVHHIHEMISQLLELR